MLETISLYNVRDFAAFSKLITAAYLEQAPLYNKHSYCRLANNNIVVIVVTKTVLKT